jgi:hypothetical protein
MSTILIEKPLQFVFDDTWWVIKWDHHPAFKAGLTKIGYTQNVDFVAKLVGAPFLIEVTDFITDPKEGERQRKSGELVKDTAAKVRDTIASLVWACGRTHLHARDLEQFVRAMFGWKGKVSVVLWVEGDPGLDPAEALSLTEELRNELRWLNPNVLVTSRLLEENRPLPGVSLKRLPKEANAPVTE